jgi:ABC-type branched-subunit amino acid transport system substrate-binding protein
LDSRALTKIQSVALIAVIVFAAVGGGAAYVLWNRTPHTTKDIKIGICGDLDMTMGKNVWRGAVLAAEQINAEGGILGRNVTVVAEDDDSETSMGDVSIATNALTKLVTVDNPDYIISPLGPFGFTYQDICAEHKKILLTPAISDELEQRVLEQHY